MYTENNDINKKLNKSVNVSFKLIIVTLYLNGIRPTDPELTLTERNKSEIERHFQYVLMVF